MKKSNRKIIYFIIFIIIIAILCYHLKEGFDTPNRGGEAECRMVCSRGILKSCTIHSPKPQSSSAVIDNQDWSQLQEGSSIYICGTAIPNFVTLLDSISVPFVLVSGDCDETIWSDVFPDETSFLSFIENPKIIRWHSQNAIGSAISKAKGKHPKLFQIPIGLDYHSPQDVNGINSPVEHDQLIQSIRSSAKPWSERLCQGYSNFHFFMTSKYGSDRVAAKDQIPAECVFYEPVRTDRVEGYRRQAEYAFVISPFGNGYDCHRTWEALCLGCIPIVRTSGLDPLYEGLPVLIVDEWSSVSMDLLQRTIQEFEKKTFDYDRLTLAYWMDRIRNGTE